MPCSAKDFFKQFFNELERREIPYVILHSYQALPEKIDSDIDFAVTDGQLRQLRGILIELARRHNWALVQTFQHEVFAFYFVLVNLDDPRDSLRLDACSHYARARRLLVPEDVLLNNRRIERGFYVPAPSAEFIYELAKLFDAKKKSPANYLPRLRELWLKDPAQAETNLKRVFGETGRSLKEWFAAPPEEWESLRTKLRARNRFGPKLLAREAARLTRRISHPTGICLAFLGSDGAGKSTLVGNLETLLEPCFRDQQTFHFRPAVFGKKTKGTVTDPHGQAPRGIVSSWLKVLYYFGDHWLGWMTQVVPAKIRSTFVIFDRDFDDLVVDPQRYRLKGTVGLTRVLRHFVPKPDRTFVLSAPASLLHERKPELPLNELERQQEVLRNLARGKNYRFISTAETPGQVARSVWNRIVVSLAAREAARAGAMSWNELFPRDGKKMVSTQMRMVKKRGEPFLLLPSNRAMALESVSLYPAQTRFARAAKAVLKTAVATGLPLPLGRAPLQIPADDAFAQFLMRQVDAKDDFPRFAILAGNPRTKGRRFLLLLFDAQSRPVCVVKAGTTTPARNLVQAESSFLENAGKEILGLPKFLGTFSSERLDALALAYVQGESPHAENRLVIGKILESWIDRSRAVCITDVPAWHALEKALVENPAADLVQRSSEMAQFTFHPVLFHGDFAPWNIRVSRADGSWTVLDWERGERTGFPGWDWFHYVIQTGILVDKHSAVAVLQRLENLFQDPAFQPYAERAGIRGREKTFALLYLSYLFHVIKPNEGIETAVELMLLLGRKK